jgi:prepilin-type processing-associated H-X9-DG protein
MAYLLYCQDNQGWMPRAAPYADQSNGESPQDYIWWQQKSSDKLFVPDRDIFNSPILRYLGFKPDVPSVNTIVDFTDPRQRVLRCPADPLSDHPPSVGIEPDGPYFFSYSLNNLMQSLDPTHPNDIAFVPINIITGKRFVVAGKLVHVRSPALKILFVEESELTINDGSFDPTSGANLLSVRHDPTALTPPDTPTGYIKVNGIWTVRNGNCRGNVSFCDGHADFVPRSYVDDPTYEQTGDIFDCDPYALR